jgi:hypothetical protein
LVEARPTLAQAYCAANNRPAIEPVLLLGVSLLQYLEGAPDRQAVDLLRYHAGWSLALNCALGQGLFHSTELVYFRQRLIDHQLSQVVFAQILEALVTAGLVDRQHKERLDSTQIMGVVARISWLECVRKTLRLALQEPEHRTALFAMRDWWERLWERYVSSQLDCRTEARVLKENLDQTGVMGWWRWTKSSNCPTRRSLPDRQ